MLDVLLNQNWQVFSIRVLQVRHRNDWGLFHKARRYSPGLVPWNSVCQQKNRVMNSQVGLQVSWSTSTSPWNACSSCKATSCTERHSRECKVEDLLEIVWFLLKFSQIRESVWSFLKYFNDLQRYTGFNRSTLPHHHHHHLACRRA